MGYLPVSSGQKLMHNMVAITSRNNVTGNSFFREIASYLEFLFIETSVVLLVF